MRAESNIIKKTLLHLTVSVAMFSLFLGLLEIVFRNTHLFGARISWTEPDSVIGYKFTPGKSYWYRKENNIPVTGRINKYGFRDKEWSLDKLPDTFRIAVLGDSYVEAFQVESDLTFITLTESKLNSEVEDDMKFELLNFGRAGYTQTHELLLLMNDVEQFSPDMVILFFLPGNDIQDISKETSSNMLSPFYHVSVDGELFLDTSFSETEGYKARRFLNIIKQHSALLSLVGERYNAFNRDKRLREVQGSDVIDPYLSLATANPDERYLENYKLNKTLIKVIAAYCKEREIKFMLVNIDMPSYVPEIEMSIAEIASSFNANYFDDDLKGYAESLEIEYIGLQRIFRDFYDTSGEFLHWLGADGHWNHKGHEVVADYLSRKLEEITEK